jgi:hypothetical protein
VSKSITMVVCWLTYRVHNNVYGNVVHDCEAWTFEKKAEKLER